MITLHEGDFQIPGSWTTRAKGAPDRKYVPARRVWIVPNNRANRKFLLSNFFPNDFDPAAFEAVSEVAPTKSIDVAKPDWPKSVLNHKDGKTYEVLPHQLEALDRAWGNKSYFFAHDMGSGKSLTLLLLFDALFKAGLIDEAWVIPPNSLIDNWYEQIETWTPWNKDKIEVHGILSLSSGSLPTRLTRRSHSRLAVAVDESQRIKNAQAKRTKVMAEIGKHAGFRFALTGTNITKGIEDLYSQYNFLDPDILGYKSFFAFRNRYCVMGGFEAKQIVGYQNVAELMEMVGPYTHVIKDPVKLPPQTEEIRVLPLSDEQMRLLRELKDQMQTEMAGTKLSVDGVLAYYTRAAQILGGFFPLEEGRVVRLTANAKLTELMDIVQSTDLKVVVFCRFVAEANMVVDALNKAGIGVRQIKANDPTLQEQVTDFRTDPGVQVIVSTYAMGSVGFTLIEGKILIEYSGTFNYEEAVQARKRIHRIGQEDQTKAIRLMASHKLDRAMKDIADRKKSISDFVNDALLKGNVANLLD